MSNNYQILSEKILFSGNKTKKVKEYKLQLPNGNIVEWEVVSFSDFLYAAPVQDGKVFMTKEWRLGPKTVVTQFTGAYCISQNEEDNLKELARELQEELGLINGRYEKLIRYSKGPHVEGFNTYYLVTDFELDKPKRDENELQEIISLPIKGVFEELSKNHVVTAETLLVAKILEERLS